MRTDSRREGPIVTLDGPAGSGKSSTAKAVAKKLGFRHLDSGALYRALTLGLLRSSVEEADWENLSEQGFTNLDINLETSENGFQVLIRGKAVDSELRTPEVTDRVSFVASLPASRQSILGLQRKAGEDGGLVADGRDMGTVVFPHAELKIYLIADLEERAMRRLREVGEDSPDDLGLAQQARALDTRDQSDSQRTISPLKKAEDAIELDTTELAFEEQVQAIADLAHQLTLL